MYITVHEPEMERYFETEASFAAYNSNKIIIEAAGGMVFNSKRELLMMKRKGKWDMPKGKLDDGETMEDCAIREVIEETGLSPLQLIKKLQTTYHTYPYQGKTALKPSHWYLMEYAGIQNPIPQTEEDITEICWADKELAKKLINNAYPSIREMVQKYFLR
ncbi:MAG: NUDIX hydrolase [Chitinophagia bacterium]|jgi:8-oxo-dGTP pyrophosphatase MutT (NUDIX family)